MSLLVPTSRSEELSLGMVTVAAYMRPVPWSNYTDLYSIIIYVSNYIISKLKDSTIDRSRAILCS